MAIAPVVNDCVHQHQHQQRHLRYSKKHALSLFTRRFALQVCTARMRWIVCQVVIASETQHDPPQMHTLLDLQKVGSETEYECTHQNA
jgi:hypothetical protein